MFENSEMYLLLFIDEVPGSAANGGNTGSEVVVGEGSLRDDLFPFKKIEEYKCNSCHICLRFIY